VLEERKEWIRQPTLLEMPMFDDDNDDDDDDDDNSQSTHTSLLSLLVLNLVY
jgi:hypothetical protein